MKHVTPWSFLGNGGRIVFWTKIGRIYFHPKLIWILSSGDISLLNGFGEGICSFTWFLELKPMSLHGFWHYFVREDWTILSERKNQLFRMTRFFSPKHCADTMTKKVKIFLTSLPAKIVRCVTKQETAFWYSELLHTNAWPRFC